jgi:hypothetical protein
MVLSSFYIAVLSTDGEAYFKEIELCCILTETLETKQFNKKHGAGFSFES